MALEYRTVQVAAEVLSSGDAAARVAIVGVEVLRSTSSGPTAAQVSSIGIEVLRSVATGGRRRQLIVG
jgi:hypothetical protein